MAAIQGGGCERRENGFGIWETAETMVLTRKYPHFLVGQTGAGATGLGGATRVMRSDLVGPCVWSDQTVGWSFILGDTHTSTLPVRYNDT